MEVLLSLIDVFLHLDKYLNQMCDAMGYWSYLIVFLVVFCETGLVVTPFLPGDSLLFALGALAATATSILDPYLCIGVISVAAFLGDTVNYSIGAFFGRSILSKQKLRFIRREHLERTREFYARHGGKTIVLARFVPVIRTFAPFVAGASEMRYFHFFIYNVAGALLWPVIFVMGGYWFGNIPIIQKNFSIVVLAIIVVSCAPIAFEVLKHRYWPRPKELPKVGDEREKNVPQNLGGDQRLPHPQGQADTPQDAGLDGST